MKEVKLDLAMSPTPMTEEHMRLRWNLRFPGNKMSDPQWKAYWERLSDMDPLMSPDHPFAERIAPPSGEHLAYAVRADLWHRIAAIVAIDPQESIGLAREPDGR